jgi:3-hydroxymyristoyl/3-hydroxydecanoyl-(acyl carrier protein) dehydratase
MDGHFRAFTFVDRITAVEKGRSIRGHYTIPAGVAEFPPSLVAEATGQLAAWSAMAAINFVGRPVAGLAGKVELHAVACPGQTLELAATLDSADDEAVSYGGTAHVDGQLLLRLEHCVGPMVPLVDFDDPEALRARFALLCGAGATPGGFGGLGPLGLARRDGEPGKLARAAFTVPQEAPWFADHFPRKPVFPGSLLLHVNLQLAAALADELGAQASSRGEPSAQPQAENAVPPRPRWTLRTVSDVKLRAFMPPGEHLELEARVLESSESTAELVVETHRGKRRIGGARVLLETEGRT